MDVLLVRGVTAVGIPVAPEATLTVEISLSEPTYRVQETGLVFGSYDTPDDGPGSCVEGVFDGGEIVVASDPRFSPTLPGDDWSFNWFEECLKDGSITPV